MVLRACDEALQALRFHTDARSPKCRILLEDPRIGLLFYDAEAAIQIRAKGTARVQTTGAEADAAWAQSSPYARRCYLAEAAPGSSADAPLSGLPDWAEGIKPVEHQLVAARDNFAILLVELHALDWLHLAHTGHRRAQFARGDDGGWDGQWVVP